MCFILKQIGLYTHTSSSFPSQLSVYVPLSLCRYICLRFCYTCTSVCLWLPNRDLWRFKSMNVVERCFSPDVNYKCTSHKMNTLSTFCRLMVSTLRFVHSRFKEPGEKDQSKSQISTFSGGESDCQRDQREEAERLLRVLR